ncbi:hypothetical protein acdb102_16010 [Acidothermaceae bacterium B102]|nr:hypothetical protein acdb102_16010 [Acidothermaceae bacterium B102]
MSRRFWEAIRLLVASEPATMLSVRLNRPVTPRCLASHVNDTGVGADLSALIARARAAASAVSERLAGLDARSVTPDQWQELSASLGLALADFRMALDEVNEALGLSSAQERLLRYLKRHVGEVLSGDALSGVAAISAWARRIRELRVEHGWRIETINQRRGLAVGEYVLASDTPDDALAATWQLASRLRRSTLSRSQKGLELLKALSPEPADKEQLSYVMEISSYSRRLRELDEQGWDIRSNVDEPSLPSGSYRLASLEQRPQRVRKAIKLRTQVMERDKFTCQDCLGRAGTLDVPLQVHHRQGVARLGGNDEANLVTLCANCHAGRHAVEGGRTVDELLKPEGDLPVPE